MNALVTEVRPILRPLLAVTAALFFITSVAYPLVVTGISQVAFESEADGSFIERDGEPVGSSLIGQTFVGEAYFHSRPSAAGAGYDAASSSGSNLGPTSAKLFRGIEDDPATTDTDESFVGVGQRVAAFRATNGLGNGSLPSDSVTASASGLDPHVSPATARLQAARVAAARGAAAAEVLALVDDHMEGRFLGLVGEPRVNVLELNLDLDARFPMAR